MEEMSQRVKDIEKKLLVSGETKNEKKFVSASPVPILASPVSVKLYTYDGKTNWEVGEAAEVSQTLTDTELLNLNSLYNALDLRFGQKNSKDYARLQRKTRHQKLEESLQEYAFEIQRLTTLAFLDFSANVREMISLEYFVDGLMDEEIQMAVRMADVKDPKSALLYALKVEAATQNRRRRIITCWGCGESGHLRSNSPLNNKEERSTKCWECGGEGHLRINCPRVNQKDSLRANVIESKKVCSHPKGSADGNIEAPPRRHNTENSKYSWRVEKKFGAIVPVVHQVTTPPTSESDPWGDESVRKDQRADTEIKQL
ncbi:uncharacterized protein TNCV_3196831 [Trichonephila clavipes]|nr:uncharacterized protein TNCV_3196831 [Trichonephila clavipes]